MIERCLILAIFLIRIPVTTWGNVPAQPASGLKGIVLNSVTGEPVQFANIENFTTMKITITDNEGIFTIEAEAGDTLIFSGIGYNYKKYIMTDSSLMNDFTVFYMDEAVYEIDEATVYVPYSYNKFKSDFLNTEVAETPADILRGDLQEKAKEVGPEAYEAALARGEIEKPGITLVKILTEDEKARIRLKKSIEERARQDLIYEKFNVEIVKMVTGMINDTEAMSFMLFCKFEEKYLIEVNPVDLLERISEKYDEYIEKQLE